MDVRGGIVVIILLLWKPDSIRSVRLLELRVPAHAAVGGEALLGCQFDMESDILYSLKWYKDGREFYRYEPKNRNPINHFRAPGVYVDVARSSSDVVTLVNLERESAGDYKCEVSGESPLFRTVFDKKFITIHVLPETGPRILGLQKHYKNGEHVVANCTSSGSRPEAQLNWLINDKAVPKSYLYGPWYRILDPPDTTETKLQLRFTTKSIYFKNGVMEIKCQATIAPLYQQETVHTITHPSITTPAPEPQTFDYEYRKEHATFSFPKSHDIIEPSTESSSSIDAEGAATLPFPEKSLTIMLFTLVLISLNLF